MTKSISCVLFVFCIVGAFALDKPIPYGAYYDSSSSAESAASSAATSGMAGSQGSQTSGGLEPMMPKHTTGRPTTIHASNVQSTAYETAAGTQGHDTSTGSENYGYNEAAVLAESTAAIAVMTTM